MRADEERKSWLRAPRLAWTILAAAAWTALVWVNRIGLITTTEAENLWAVARIAGSLGSGAALVVVAWRLYRSGHLRRIDKAVLAGFFVWTATVWVPSLVSVLPGAYSTPFKLVHAFLAATSLLWAGTLVRAVYPGTLD